MAWKIRRAGLRTGDSNPVGKPPFRVKGRVGRIENPPRDAFFNRYVAGNRPVAIKGAMADWPGRRWSAPYLAEALGDFACEAIVSVNGLYPDYLSKPEPMKKAAMSIAEFWERASGVGGYAPILAPGETYYIYGKPHIFKANPELKRDTPLPSFLEGGAVSSLNLWMSSPGCVTPLHYDLTNGALCQLIGSKHVYLFAPDQRERLYQRGPSFPGMDNFERQSQVDIHHPDTERFPEFSRAEAWECTLRPGDILFLPSNWFHEVETLEFSVSVSFAFAGGTAASEFAAMAERFKEGRLDLAALQRELMRNPEAMRQMMDLPMMKEMLANPALLAQLSGMAPRDE